jgi:hypothetical protein
LKSLRNDVQKIEHLKEMDTYGLLPEIDPADVREPGEPYKFSKPKEINSIDDILGDDLFDDLSKDDEGLFDFKHTPKEYDRAMADFVARRKPCKDFNKFEVDFKQVQKDLASGKRKLVPFKESILKEGNYYVNNGVLLYLESVDFEKRGWSRGDNEQNRIRKYDDGRTRTIFENGTESRMLFRSLGKVLLINGKAVTQNIDNVNEGFIEKFSSVTEEDKEAGYIYVLRSKSTDERIRSITNLYKIGYSKSEVTDRIKNAEREPTYLMASVEYITGWKCYNMNPQKLEQLLHNFFGSSCLNIDIYDEKGRRHTPREWFIAPLAVIENVIELIISGEILHYRYDADTESLVPR